MRALLLALVLSVLVLVPPAMAIYADQQLPDPAGEQRARSLMRELRCLVCQNQAIDNSNASMARDLRMVVRERIAAGDSIDEARQYMVDRYGDWVLLNPPFRVKTAALWAGPGVLLLIGIGGIALAVRRRLRQPAAAPVPLSDKERDRLANLMSEER